MARSLYFHFPFCETKCHYCDFYSLGREKTKSGDAATFENAMIAEIKLRGDRGEIAPEIDTIFLGGGTPSMTPPESMQKIFETLFLYTKLAPDYEWTMEANPSSIELTQFQAYRKLGLNRVSMGVQSLRNDHLANLGRVHNENKALEALDAVFAAGFNNVSTDLLCGVPGQSLDDIRAHIDRLTQFPLTHLSIYLLTLAPHHRMFKDLPQEDEQLAHLLCIDERMRANGFLHYEISNFAKSSTYRARHNLAYWKNQSYLSFGPSAHSFDAVKKERSKNFSSLHKWASTLVTEKQLAVEWTESLTPDQEEIEKWLLAIRLDEGFPKIWLESVLQQKKAKRMLDEGYLEIHPEKPEALRATVRGFSMSDAIVKELI